MKTIKFQNLKIQSKTYKNLILNNISKVLDSGDLFLGDEVKKFEKFTSQFIQVKYASGVSSGSSALYLALRSLDIGPGDEVITTPLTWIITANAIASVGATPVFIDTSDDFNINSDLIERAINKKTKAILPMHYAGHMCKMNHIKNIAKNYNLFLIEDAAQAFGASLNGRMAGSFSNVAAFSMNPMKVLNGFGENGLVTTNSFRLHNKIKMLRHAGTKSDYRKKKISNDCYHVSLNHKMDSINAAALNISFSNFKKKKKKLNNIAKYYDENINNKIIKQKLLKGEVHGRYAYPILIVKNRADFIHYLQKKGIDTRVFHQPLASNSPVFKKLKNFTPVADYLSKQSLVIPFNESLKNSEVTYIVKTINKFF